MQKKYVQGQHFATVLYSVFLANIPLPRESILIGLEYDFIGAIFLAEYYEVMKNVILNFNSCFYTTVEKCLTKKSVNNEFSYIN